MEIDVETLVGEGWAWNDRVDSGDMNITWQFNFKGCDMNEVQEYMKSAIDVIPSIVRRSLIEELHPDMDLREALKLYRSEK